MRVVAKQEYLGTGESMHRNYCSKVGIDEGIGMLIGYIAAEVEPARIISLNIL
jgi:hypothetical protein